jgi:hypothetical protein
VNASTALTASLLFALAAGCSENKLRPGYCESDGDCSSGQRCLLSGAATFMCAAADGGSFDGDVSDGADAADAEVTPECTMSAQCPAAKPICDGGSCRACDPAAVTDGQACASRDSTKQVCGPMGSCVQCASANSADCTTDSTKPICDLTSNTCVSCTTDDQCVTKGVGPGICMSHQDGRCAADSEVIYVENKAGCVTDAVAAGSGTSATPFCGPQPALGALTIARRVILASGTVTGLNWTIPPGAAPISIISLNGAVFAGGATAGIQVSGVGELYVRGVIVRSSELEGVIATSGSNLRLERVTVDSNRGGGILLDGAPFDIRNTTVTNNGPSSDLSWGGIRVQGLPATGSTNLHLVTIQGNKAPGLSCAAAIQGDGVFASGNSTGDVSGTCGVTACSPAGPTCGAQ